MTFERLKGPFVALVGVLILGGALALGSVPAQAQVRPHVRVFVTPRPFIHSGFYWGYPYYYPYATYDPIAYQKESGYSDGLSRGKSDAKHGKADDPNSHSHYRDSKSLAYREAFLQGYEQGFRDYRG
jgi:hypothetical protein